MKKLFFIFVIFFLVIQPVFAINLEVTKKSSDEVMIYEFQNPIEFELDVKNLGESDTFMFYNLVSFALIPEKVSINKDETKVISLIINPLAKIETKGPFNFNYYIRGEDRSEIKQKLIFKVFKLEDVFEIGSEKLDINSNKINIYVKNNINYNFSNLEIDFNSVFFDFSKKFSLNSYGKKIFEVQLNKEDIDKLLAGFYTLKADLKTNGEEVFLKGIIEFSEEDSLIETLDNYGFIINTHIIEKENKGNVVETSTTLIKKNIFSRLFTSFSPEPNIVNREGFIIYYTWNSNLNPGESTKISVKTNWLIPFLIIILVIAITILSKRYSKTDLILRKKVSFVKTKGGEFALKVSILVNARKYVEKINVMDKLPPLVKVYEKFGAEIPSRIDEKAKKIEWSFEKLESGEKRVLSYIVYSKLGVLGRFALPSSTAIYEKEGKIKEVYSNRAFFVSEQKGNVREE